MMSHGHHQMVNTEIRLIIFFAVKDGEALYSQQKQDRELTGSDHELLIAIFRHKLKKVDGIMDSMDVSLSELQEMVMNREAWLRFMGSQRIRHDSATELN